MESAVGSKFVNKKHRALIRILVSFAALLAVTLIAAGGRFQSRANDDRGDDNNKKLLGSWDVTITTTPNPPFQIPFRILRTVTDSGVVDAYAFPSITPTPGPLINSAGHGDWVRLGRNLYSVTVKYFQLNPAAPLDKLDTVGKVRENIRLSQDGNSYVSVFETEISLPNGTKIITNNGQTVAHRIAVEPLSIVP